VSIIFLRNHCSLFNAFTAQCIALMLSSCDNILMKHMSVIEGNWYCNERNFEFEIETLIIPSNNTIDRNERKKRRIYRLFNCSLMYFSAAGRALKCENVFKYGLKGDITMNTMNNEGSIRWRKEFNELTNIEMSIMSRYYRKRKDELLNLSCKLARRIRKSSKRMLIDEW
jgi:hypothetical protein